MKMNMTISVDFEIVEKLRREDNYSKLINQLLNDHYSMDALKTLPLPELKRKLEIAERKQALKEEMEALENE